VAIARLETGETQDGTADTIRKLAEAFGVPPAVVRGELAGVQSVDELIERFKSSPWALTMKPPPTADELDEVRDLGDAVWTKIPATEEAVFHLVNALRAEKSPAP